MTPNTLDWNNRTYWCGNCGCPRSIDDTLCVEQCPKCGDDETTLGAFGDPLASEYETGREPIKVVFLDIDGVMNSVASVEAVKVIRAHCPNWPESHPLRHTPVSSWKWFAPWSVEALNYITGTTGAKIVISSTWRESAIPWLRRWGVTGDIIGQTPILDRFVGSISVAMTRGEEIEAWFDKWARTPGSVPVSTCVVLDDDPVGGAVAARLVQTDGQTGRGLTMAHARRAIALLEQDWSLG